MKRLNAIGHCTNVSSTALPEDERVAKLLLDLRHTAEWSASPEITWLLWEAADEIEELHNRKPWWRFW